MRSTIVIFVLVFTVLGLLLGFSASFNVEPNNKVASTVASIESKVDGYVFAMQSSSSLPAVKSTKYIDSISTAQMGIPENADTDKREVAKQLLSQHPEIASIFFLTPSGDLYLGEPFDQQKQLPRLNYADRDWYSGVHSTNKPYVSLVFMSAAIHRPAIAVAVPVSAEDQVAGYWVAIIGVDEFGKSLKQSGIAEGSRIVLVDHNGTEIADTAATAPLSEIKSYANLQSVQRALSGESGTVVEQIDGVDMKATFAPVMADPNTWALVVIEPAK